MREVTGVLDRQKGINDVLRKLLVRDVIADFRTKLVDHVSRVVEDSRVGQCGKAVLGEAHSFRVVDNVDQDKEYRDASDQKKGQNRDGDFVPRIQLAARFAGLRTGWRGWFLFGH